MLIHAIFYGIAIIVSKVRSLVPTFKFVIIRCGLKKFKLRQAFPLLSIILLKWENMTLQHFNKLSQHKKHRNLLVNGVWLADRQTEEATVLLFQLDSFYVEIFFSKQDDDITQSNCFDSVDYLDPYLEDIDLSCIV